MIQYENKDFYTVFEINDYIKSLFDNTITLQNIGIIGEVSNFRGANRTGHLYFNLKDENSSLNCVMFKFDVLKNDVNISNGDQILVIGSISSYIVNGSYQLIIKKIIPFGEGNLLLNKERLKKKLADEGIFDENHKLTLIEFPHKISVITGKNSAAEKDFLFNLNRRNPLVEVEFIYSSVQGKEALKDLLLALDKAEKSDSDMIILGRGGGASEDLNVFDEEELVRRIYDLKKPIITAIGHEINLSLCDLVSDRHASTPTGACEYAVSDINDIINELNYLKSNIYKTINNKISECSEKISLIKTKKEFVSIDSLYDSYLLKLSNLKASNDRYMLSILNSNQEKINELKQKLILKDCLKILNDGYSIVYKNNNIIKDINDVDIDDILKIKLANGEIYVKVIDNIKKEK